eukprot:260162-Prorocentrum_lima.AAC.1
MTLAVLNGIATKVPAVVETKLIEPLVAYSGVTLNIGIEELKSVCAIMAEVLRDNGLMSVHLLKHCGEFMDPT